MRPPPETAPQHGGVGVIKPVVRLQAGLVFNEQSETFEEGHVQTVFSEAEQSLIMYKTRFPCVFLVFM